MVDKNHQQLSIVIQCKLLKLNRSSYYYSPTAEPEYNLVLMKIIDQEYMNYPFFGSRQMKRHLNRQGYIVSRNRVRRLMRKMGLVAIYQKPKTTGKNKQLEVYPYLLRNLEINQSNQVWCSDITYIPMRRGFMYLVAVIDWYSRKVLSWQLSNTLDVAFCLNALDKALAKYGRPKIFNTDQGSQYTSADFTGRLKDINIKISMDGKGCWVDNVFIERLWRSLKYECIYLQEFDTVQQLNASISSWINFYNDIRPHSVFNGKTPKEVYYDNLMQQTLNLAA